MSNLAVTLFAQGELDRARELQERVLEVRSAGASVAEHPDTLTAMGNLALTLQAQGELGGARKLQENILQIIPIHVTVQSSGPGAGFPVVAANLAGMERGEAEAIYDSGREACVQFILDFAARVEQHEERLRRLEEQHGRTRARVPGRRPQIRRRRGRSGGRRRARRPRS